MGYRRALNLENDICSNIKPPNFQSKIKRCVRQFGWARTLAFFRTGVTCKFQRSKLLGNRHSDIFQCCVGIESRRHNLAGDKRRDADFKFEHSWASLYFDAVKCQVALRDHRFLG